jgi:hypothetical protein
MDGIRPAFLMIIHTEHNHSTLGIREADRIFDRDLYVIFRGCPRLEIEPLGLQIIRDMRVELSQQRQYIGVGRDPLVHYDAGPWPRYHSAGSTFRFFMMGLNTLCMVSNLDLSHSNWCGHWAWSRKSEFCRV